MYIKENELYFVLTINNIKANILLGFSLLNKVVYLLRNLFNQINSYNIEDNAIIVFQLINEIFQFGHCQINLKEEEIYEEEDDEDDEENDEDDIIFKRKKIYIECFGIDYHIYNNINFKDLYIEVIDFENEHEKTTTYNRKYLNMILLKKKKYKNNDEIYLLTK